jgi:hypothetical protein
VAWNVDLDDDKALAMIALFLLGVGGYLVAVFGGSEMGADVISLVRDCILLIGGVASGKALSK